MTKQEYARQYYAKLKAKRAENQVKQQPQEPIDLAKVRTLSDLMINENMLKLYKTGTDLDKMFSHEGGIPVGTNVMCTGDPGVGKTTLLMHALSNLQRNNPGAKCLFISAEMSKIQVFKYTNRFPEFTNLKTLFTSDFLNCNSKQVFEEAIDSGYDYVLIDSIAEVLDSVKEDASMSQGQAEKWIIDLCVKNNEANNKAGKNTTFLLIQQVTKNGVFVGSNKLKHITDAHMEIKRYSENDGGGTYIVFSKNRNGASGVRYGYRLGSNSITYDLVTENEPVGQFSLEEEAEMAF